MNPAERSDRRLEEIAAEWLCERDEGFAPARAREFAAWRDADPAHAAAFARVERTWALLAEMSAIQSSLEARLGPRAMAASSRARATPFPRAAWLGGLAAATIFGVVIWAALHGRGSPTEHYVAGEAVPQHVALADGSSIDLNAGSEVQVHFSAAERRVQLVRGEAHFDVAKNPARPFWVEAGAVAVRAVGTAFNVRRAAAEVEILVTEGKVEISNRADSARPPDSTTASRGPRDPTILGSPTALIANQRVVVSPAASRAPVESLAPDAVRAALAWQDTRLVFLNTPLREVIARFNRRNVTQLALAEEGLGDRKIGGMIALDQVEAFVRLLEQEGDLVAAPRGDGVIVLRRAR